MPTNLYLVKLQKQFKASLSLLISLNWIQIESKPFKVKKEPKDLLNLFPPMNVHICIRCSQLL